MPLITRKPALQRVGGYLIEKYVHIHGCQKIVTIPIPKVRPFIYFLYKQRGGIIYLGVLKKGAMSYIGYPPPRFLTIYGTGSVKKKIDFHYPCT